MSVSDWVLLVSTIIIALSALLVPYVSEQIKRKCFAPSLIIKFYQTPPGCHLTKLQITSGIESLTGPVFYFRFKVQNKGKSQARRCEAVLDSIQAADASGEFRTLPQFSPTNLIWGSGESSYVDINPERSYFCDLVDVPYERAQSFLLRIGGNYVNPTGKDSFPLGIHLCTKAVLFSQPNRLPPGRYRLQVSIYSENAAVARAQFEITWSGNWQDTEDLMFKELVINKVL